MLQCCRVMWMKEIVQVMYWLFTARRIASCVQARYVTVPSDSHTHAHCVETTAVPLASSAFKRVPVFPP